MELERLKREIDDLHSMVKKTGNRDILGKVEDIQRTFRDVEAKYRKYKREARKQDDD
jgi:hypothetical protein